MKIQYIEEFKQFVNDTGIPMEDFCLVGSCALTFKNIRSNHDLEFMVNPKKHDEILKYLSIKDRYWHQFAVSENIDYFHNMYALVGFDDNFIWDNELFDISEGIKIIDFELEYLYKIKLSKMMKREKDKQDINNMQKILSQDKLQNRLKIKNSCNGIIVRIRCKFSRFKHRLINKIKRFIKH